MRQVWVSENRIETETCLHSQSSPTSNAVCCLFWFVRIFITHPCVGIKELFLHSCSSGVCCQWCERADYYPKGWSCWLQHFCHCSVAAGEELFANMLVPTASWNKCWKHQTTGLWGVYIQYVWADMWVDVSYEHTCIAILCICVALGKWMCVKSVV